MIQGQRMRDKLGKGSMEARRGQMSEGISLALGIRTFLPAHTQTFLPVPIREDALISNRVRTTVSNIGF